MTPYRIDAAKHMWPDHLKQIISKIDNLNPEFGFEKDSRPFIYQEVIDMGGEPITAIEYTGSGRVTEFRFGAKLGRVLRKFDKLKWLNNFGMQTLAGKEILYTFDMILLFHSFHYR